MFAQRMDPARLVYLDGYSGFRNPEDFMENIWTKLSAFVSKPSETGEEGQPAAAFPPLQPTVIDGLNRYAMNHPQGIVLMLDTFEQFGAIEGWLRNHFLCQLHSRVKVILAGRYALTGQWRGSDFLPELDHLSPHARRGRTKLFADFALCLYEKNGHA